MGRRAEALFALVVLGGVGAGAWWLHASGPTPVEEAPVAPPTPKRGGKKRAAAPAEPEGRCLPPPELAEDAGEEAGFAASVGLSREQIRGAMGAALPALSDCITGDWPEAELLLEITVACTGRVSRVKVLDDGGLEGALVACVTERLGSARFPAHDLPDGEVFQYPVQFSR